MSFYSQLVHDLVKQGFHVEVDLGVSPAEDAAWAALTKLAYAQPEKKRPEVGPHQKRVLDKLDNTRGVIVAHSMGAGKTLTALLAAERAQKKQPGKMVTAVVPAPLVTNMLDQAKEHGVDLDYDHFQVMSYDKAVNEMPRLMGQSHSLVIFDEAHRVRNKDTRRSSQLDKLLSKADNTLFLTGTPAYNNPSDLAVLVNKASGRKLLPDDKKEFDQQFIGVSQVSPGFFAHNVLRIPNGEVQHLKNRHQLKRILSQHVDVYDAQEATPEFFPTSTSSVIRVEMDGPQQDIYRFVEGNVPAFLRWKIRMGLPLNKQESKDLNAFATGVRQASNSIAPYVTSPSLKGHTSPKIRVMADRIEHQASTDPNFRSVAYSNYIESGLKPLSRELTRRGVSHAIYDGSVSKADKDAMVHAYNSGKLKTILISSSGAEGLNLKGTKLVQVMEPHFNRSKVDQIVARGIRFKSHMHLPPEERHVKVEHYQSVFHRSLWDKMTGSSPKTIDEYLYDLSARKQKVQDEMKDLMKSAELTQAILENIGHTKQAFDPVTFGLTAFGVHLAQNAAVASGVARGGMLKAVGEAAEKSKAARWGKKGGFLDFSRSETLGALSKLKDSPDLADSFYRGFHGKSHHPLRQVAGSFAAGATVPETEILSRHMHDMGRRFRTKLDEANAKTDSMFTGHPELAKYARPGNLTDHEKEFYGRIVSGDLIGAHTYYHNFVKGKSVLAETRINAAADKVSEALNYDMKGVLHAGDAEHRKVLQDATKAVQSNLLTHNNASSLARWREASDTSGSFRHKEISSRTRSLAQAAGNVVASAVEPHVGAVNALKTLTTAPEMQKVKPTRFVQDKLDSILGTQAAKKAWGRGLQGQDDTGTLKGKVIDAVSYYAGNPATASANRLANKLGLATHSYHQVSHPGEVPSFSRYDAGAHIKDVAQGIVSRYQGGNVDDAVHNAVHRGVTNKGDADRHLAAMTGMSPEEKVTYLSNQGIDTKKIREEQSRTRRARNVVHAGAGSATMAAAAAAAMAGRSTAASGGPGDRQAG